MKKLTLYSSILLIFMISGIGFTQSFSWQTGTTTKYVNPGDFGEFHTYLNSSDGHSLTLRVIRTQLNIPTGWTNSICTSLGCLPPDVDTTLIILPPNGTDSLMIDFWTDFTLSVGKVEIKVENLSNLAEVYFEEFTLSSGPSAIRPGSGNLSGTFQLHQNFPNPFNPSTTILFEVGGSALQKTSLKVFNLLGQEIRTLFNEPMAPGLYQAQWDGRDQFGLQVPSGIYFYELRSGATVLTGKMVLTR
ncbi:MAG: FlgD immunoglobulin-like domain containing protein [Calditrichia bacterium]